MDREASFGCSFIPVSWWCTDSSRCLRCFFCCLLFFRTTHRCRFISNCIWCRWWRDSSWHRVSRAWCSKWCGNCSGRGHSGSSIRLLSCSSCCFGLQEDNRIQTQHKALKPMLSIVSTLSSVKTVCVRHCWLNIKHNIKTLQDIKSMPFIVFKQATDSVTKVLI